MTSPSITPARGRLLVRPVETAETFGGRIIVPHETRERITANQVEVIAVGAFAECDPTRSKAERKCEHEHDYEINGELHHKAARMVGDRRVHAHAITAGSWCLVRPRSCIAGPDPERAEYFVHQDDVLGIFNEN